MTSSAFVIFSVSLLLLQCSRLVASCCDDREHSGHYICEDGCRQFPWWSYGSTNISITGGDFRYISMFAFPDTAKIITIRQCSIGYIDSQAFNRLKCLFVLKFQDVIVGRINSDAFNDLEFKVTEEFPTRTEDDLSFQFLSSTLGIIETNAFRSINLVKQLTFTDVTITAADNEAFRDVTMADEGHISLRNVIAHSPQGFPGIDRIRNVSEVYIEDLHQYALSNDLVDQEVHTHTLKSSTFNITQENLSNQNYDDVILYWSDVTVHCGDDIDWLMKDKDSIPGEMLNSLVCNGPERLAGEHIADLSEEEWLGIAETTPTIDDAKTTGSETTPTNDDVMTTDVRMLSTMITTTDSSIVSTITPEPTSEDGTPTEVPDAGVNDPSTKFAIMILLIVVGTVLSVGMVTVMVLWCRRRTTTPDVLLPAASQSEKVVVQTVVDLPPPYEDSNPPGLYFIAVPEGHKNRSSASGHGKKEMMSGVDDHVDDKDMESGVN